MNIRWLVFQGKAQRRINAVHVMDALILNGTDVRDQHFNQRYVWCEKISVKHAEKYLNYENSASFDRHSTSTPSSLTSTKTVIFLYPASEWLKNLWRPWPNPAGQTWTQSGTFIYNSFWVWFTDHCPWWQEHVMVIGNVNVSLPEWRKFIGWRKWKKSLSGNTVNNVG